MRRNKPTEPFQTDNYARCTKCFVDKDHIWGTPLMAVEVSVYQKGAPNIPVADVAMCPTCRWIYRVRCKGEAAALDITAGTVENCIRQSSCSSFHLHELRSGQVDAVVVPEHIGQHSAPAQAAPDFADPSGGTREPEPEATLF